MKKISEKQRVKILRDAYRNMKARCNNKNNPEYSRYGGRGIKISPEWNDFADFYADMGFSYEPGKSIDRIDNDLGYSYENCRWANQKEQCNNRSTNRLITHEGKTMNVSQWAEYKNLPVHVLGQRLKDGWNEIDAITRPTYKRPAVAYLTINGIRKSMNEWAKESTVSKASIQYRLGLGYSPEDAVFKPKVR